MDKENISEAITEIFQDIARITQYVFLYELLAITMNNEHEDAAPEEILEALSIPKKVEKRLFELIKESSDGNDYSEDKQFVSVMVGFINSIYEKFKAESGWEKYVEERYDILASVMSSETKN